MAIQSNRRDLKFDNFDDVKAEMQRLLSQGYTKHGNWNLAQTCMHLHDWMRYPMDGFPKPPFFMRILFFLFKITGASRRMAKNILENGFKPGTPTAPDTVHTAAGKSDEEAVATLKETIDRFRSHNGAFHDSPLFGSVDKPTAEKVQLLHCAHHLGFLEPKNEGH